MTSGEQTTTREVLAACGDPRIHDYGVTLEAVARLGRVFDRSLRERCGISQSWFEALLRIARSGGQMTMGDLAAQVAITSGGVTRLVDRLIDEGLVERRSCATDRRVQYVAITEHGTEKLGEATAVHLRDIDEHFVGRMSEEERAVVVEVMDRLRRPEAGSD